MKIQHKVITILVSSFALMLVFLTIYGFLSDNQRIIHYNSIVESKKIIVKNVIQNQQGKYNQLVNDYSSWDGMVDFIKTPTKQWSASNLESMPAIYKVDYVWIYNPDLQPVFAKSITKLQCLDTLPIAKKQIPKLFKIGKNVHFFLKIGPNILEVFGGRVAGTKEYFHENTLTPRGYFFVAKWWDIPFIENLAITTDTDVEFDKSNKVSSHEIFADVKSDAHFVIRYPLLDENFKVVAVLKFENTLTTVARWGYYNQLTIITGFALLLLTIVLSISLINRWISYPMRRITKTLNTSDVSNISPILKRTDEFGKLSQLLVKHFEVQKQLYEEIDNHNKTQFALSEKEKSLSLLINNISDIVWTMDLNFVMSYVTPSVTQHFQYAPEEFVILKLEQLFIPKSVDEGVEFFTQMRDDLLKGKHHSNTGFQTELIIRCKDGKPLWVSVIAKPLFDDQANVTGIHGTMVNIDNYKKAIFAAAQAHQEVVNASAVKSDFMANMSHEIRTPLNGIIGMTELVLHTDLHDSQEIYVQNIKQSANVLHDIVTDILDFSKIEAGKLKLLNEQFELAEIVLLSLNVFSAKCELKKVELSCFIDPRLPKMVFGDPTRLKQVIMNILGNAIKFTDQGEIELRVTPLDKTYDPLHPQILFSIRDTGIGIPENKLHEIFDSFSQVDRSFSKKHEGTGLGLTISKKLVELMDGDIWVESKMEEGSIFKFKIPFLVSDSFEPAVFKQLEINRVVVFDNHQANIQTLQTYFDQLNINYQFFAECPISEKDMDQFKEAEVLFFNVQNHLLDYEDNLKSIRFFAQLGKKIVIIASPTIFFKIQKAVSVSKYPLFHLPKPYSFNVLYHLLEFVYSSKSLASTTIVLKKEQVVFPNKTVLVAEDNNVNFLIIKEMLKKMQVKVIGAINGMDAIDKLLKNDVDFIFMDIHMPDMDGVEATHVIRKMDDIEKQKVPIVALTADAMPGYKERCIEVGMDDYITKPYSQSTIINCLKKYLK